MSALLPSNVSLNVAVSDVTCCTCVPSGQGTVSVPTKHGEPVDIPKKHHLVLSDKGTLTMSSSKGTSQDENRAAVEKYVSELSEKNSPQLMAVLAAWKEIDFAEFHRLGTPLGPMHIASMEYAFQDVAPFHDVLQWECQSLAKFPVTSKKGLNLSSNQREIRQLLKNPDGSYPDINSAVSEFGVLHASQKGTIPRLEIKQNTAARIVECARVLSNTHTIPEIRKLLDVDPSNEVSETSQLT